jgi:hypothetical protein
MVKQKGQSGGVLEASLVALLRRKEEGEAEGGEGPGPGGVRERYLG